MSASVSRLARLRPLCVAGGGSSTGTSDSIWKGKEPKPEDAVERLEPVDKPNVRLLGGAGSASNSLID